MPPIPTMEREIDTGNLAAHDPDPGFRVPSLGQCSRLNSKLVRRVCFSAAYGGLENGMYDPRVLGCGQCRGAFQFDGRCLRMRQPRQVAMGPPHAILIPQHLKSQLVHRLVQIPIRHGRLEPASPSAQSLHHAGDSTQMAGGARHQSQCSQGREAGSKLVPSSPSAFANS